MSSEIVSHGDDEDENCLLPDWNNVPEELWILILDKLVDVSDYLRFGAVCKSWRCIAAHKKQKQGRIATINKQPPMLCFTTKEFNHTYCGLYSLSEDISYTSAQLRLPFGVLGYKILGCAYGWFIIEMWTIPALCLYNSFTKKSYGFRLPENTPSMEKAALSCDPSTCYDDLAIAITYCNRGRVTLLWAADAAWTNLAISVKGFRDIIFHGGLLWALEMSDYRLVAIDYMNDEKWPIVLHHYNMGLKIQGSLVASPDGDLLLVQTFSDWEPTEFRVYKMSGSNSSDLNLHWVKVEKLGENDAIFVSHRHCCCISVSGFPNCMENCVYFISPSECFHGKCKGIRVFRMSDKTISKVEGGGVFEGHLDEILIHPAWIPPSASVDLWQIQN